MGCPEKLCTLNADSVNLSQHLSCKRLDKFIEPALFAQ